MNTPSTLYLPGFNISKTSIIDIYYYVLSITLFHFLIPFRLYLINELHVAGKLFRYPGVFFPL